VFVTNVRDTRPPRKQPGKVKAAEVAAALPRLAGELAGLTECRSLLAVGGDALRAILGVGEISKFHASMWSRVEVDAIRSAAVERGIPVVEALPPKLHTLTACYHPAFTMHGGIPQFRPMLQATIQRAERASRMEETAAVRPPASVFNLWAFPAAVEAALAEADRLNLPVAFDVEGYEQITIAGCRVGGQVLVWEWNARMASIIREWMARPGVVVGHNFLSDLSKLAQYGITPGKRRVVVDTIVAEALLRPSPKASKDDEEGAQRKWFALPTCVTYRVPGSAYWKEAVASPTGRPDKAKWRWATLAAYRATWPMIGPEWQEALHNGLDNWWTGELWKVQRALLERRGML
jgi:hypothetical protein